MKKWTRRDLLKTSVLAPAATVAAHEAVGSARANLDLDGGIGGAGLLPTVRTPESAQAGAGRERLLLDFGWRFHFGHADDPAQDFGFGSGRSGNFQKTGNFLPAGALAFNDGDWRPLDLPHDWAVELPFENDPSLSSKGFYPLGRKYPATSVGWYRRVFELCALQTPRFLSGKEQATEFLDNETVGSEEGKLVH